MPDDRPDGGPDRGEFGTNAALPPDILIGDRYTPTGWLDILRGQFLPDDWRAAIAAEALRLGVVRLFRLDETKP